MNPKEYYYNQFNRDLQEMIAKSPGVHQAARDIHIPIGEIKPEKISFESNEHRHYFFSALMLTFLIDQVIYSHFHEDYDEFKKLTQYPKLEFGATTGINLKPWYASQSTGINEQSFRRFAEFFINDLKDFFRQHKFTHATWDTVKSAMLNDVDVKEGIWGEIFIEILQKST